MIVYVGYAIVPLTIIFVRQHPTPLLTTPPYVTIRAQWTAVHRKPKPQCVFSIASRNSGWTAGQFSPPLKLLECDKPIISNQEGLPGVYYWL